MKCTTIVCLLLVLILPACGGGDTDNASVRLMGSLGDGYASTESGEPAGDDQGVSAVCTLPASIRNSSDMDRSLRSTLLHRVAHNNIAADGSFSVEVDRSLGVTVYLLVNTSATNATNKVVGYLAVQDEGQSLVSIPNSGIKADIDLGKVNRTGNEALSSATLGQLADRFSLAPALLQSMARNDEILKGVKNTYINYDSSSGQFYLAVVNFEWVASPSNGFTGTKNVYTQPDASQFVGYSIAVSTSEFDPPSLSALVDESAVVSLHPPVSVESMEGSETFAPDTPIDSSGLGEISTLPGDMQYSVSSNGWFQALDNGQFREYGFGGREKFFKTEQVPGWWTLKVDGTPRAWFDLAVAMPVSNQKPRSFFPAIRVNVGDGGKVTGLDIQWYYYDFSVGAYQQVSDPTVVSYLFPRLSVYLYDMRGGDNRIELGFRNISSYSSLTGWSGGLEGSNVDDFGEVTDKSGWYWYSDVTDDGSKVVLNRVAIVFETGNLDFRVDWRLHDY